MLKFILFLELMIDWVFVLVDYDDKSIFFSLELENDFGLIYGILREEIWEF